MSTATVPQIVIRLRSGDSLQLQAVVQTDLGDEHQTCFQDARDSSGFRWSRRKNKFCGWSKWLRLGGRTHETIDSMSAAQIENL